MVAYWTCNLEITTLTIIKQFLFFFLFTTGWLAGVACFLGSVMLPLSLALDRKLGTRKTVGLGIILGTVSLSVMGACSNYWLMLISFGVGYGVSSCLIKAPPVFLIAQYFPYHHPHHVLATSLSLCGSSVGMHILSTLSIPLCDHFLVCIWDYLVMYITGLYIPEFIKGCKSQEFIMGMVATFQFSHY